MTLLRGVLIAALLALSSVHSGAQTQRPPQAATENSGMADFTLTLTAPDAPVLQGEDFEVTLTLTNTGAGPVDAPEVFDEQAFAFVLEGAFETLRLSRVARDAFQAPGQFNEHMPAPPQSVSRPLPGGEARIYKFHPARLTNRPIPPGDYRLSAVLVAEGLATDPAALTILARRLTDFRFHTRGAAEGNDLLFVHQNPDGSKRLFHALTPIDDPLSISGVAVADLPAAEGPTESAIAARTGREDGPAFVAWLDQAGAITGAVAYSTFVAGRTRATPLGLEAPKLQRNGWQAFETDARATFAALGERDGRHGLALAWMDADRDWAVDVTTVPLPIDGDILDWRVARIAADDGFMLIYAPASGGVFALRLSADGKPQGGPRVLADAETPFAAMAASKVLAGSADRVHLLLGPAEDADGPHMVFQSHDPIGAERTERTFLIPVDQGQTPTDWALADVRPGGAALTARLGANLLGLNIAQDTSGGVLRRDVDRTDGLIVRRAGAAIWALWLDGRGELHGQIFAP